MFKVNEEEAKEIIINKRELCSYEKAIRFARRSGIAEESMDELKAKQHELKNVSIAIRKSVIERMQFSKESVAELVDGNYGVLFYSEHGKVCLSITSSLTKSDAEMLALDSKPIKKSLYDSMKLASSTHEDPDEFQEEVEERCKEIIEDAFGMHFDNTEFKPHHKLGGITISNHAIKRYRQRIDTTVENVDVEMAIMELFEQSLLLFVDRYSGVYFYHHRKNNIIFVVINNVLCTLYISDRGYSHAINRSITIQQARVIDMAYHRCNRLRDLIGKRNAHKDKLIKSLQKQRDVLDKRIRELKVSKKDDEVKLNDAVNFYKDEYSKLFRKYEEDERMNA